MPVKDPSGRVLPQETHMTVKELADYLNTLVAQGCGDHGVTVYAHKVICGYNIQVTGAHRGFDWTKNQVVLHTNTPLQPVEKKEKDEHAT